MFLFKKESKEDKERRKAEKEKKRDAKHAQHLSTSQNANVNLTSVKITTQLSCDSQTDTSATTELNSSSSTLNKGETSPIQTGGVNAPPRPKKGILKGMSKFSIGSHAQSVEPKSATLPSDQKRSRDVGKLIDGTNLNLPDIKRPRDDLTLRTVDLSSVNAATLAKIRLDEATYGIECADFFLPGDCLLEINGRAVTALPFAEARHLVSTPASKLVLTVKTSLENIEFIHRHTIDGLKVPDKNLNLGSLRRVGSLRHRKTAANVSPTKSTSSMVHIDHSPTTCSLSSQSSFGNDECVYWLVHTNGYSAATVLQGGESASGKLKVRLDNGHVIEVSEENLERANPWSLDRVEDLSTLRFINETSLIHTIRQRYGSSLVYTHAGPSLVCVKPGAPLTIYNDKVAQMFKGCKVDDMPPHIYSFTQSVYRHMISTRSDNSIVLMGHSGSGKSAQCHHVIDYLAKVATPAKEVSTFEAKINAMFCILEAFSCVQTPRNETSSRYLSCLLLEFSHTGQWLSLMLQLISMDHTRVSCPTPHETNFLVFYYMLSGCDQVTRTELHLDANANVDSNHFIRPTFRSSHQLPSNSWQNLLKAFKTLQFSDDELKAIHTILATIYHLGFAGAQTHPSNNRATFSSTSDAQRAAQLLGCTIEHLAENVFTLYRATSSTSKFGSSHTSPDHATPYQHSLSATECLQGFTMGLYQECINLITTGINRAFKSPNQASACSLMIIDPPGFQWHSDANYADLMCNYLSERLQLLFYQLHFINPIDKFTQEGLDCGLAEHMPASPSALINLLDKPPHMIRTMPLTSNSSEPLGLMWQLEEEILAQSKNAASFIKKVTDSDRKRVHASASDSKPSHLSIHHQFGEFVVDYNVSNWLQSCREFVTARNALPLIHESRREYLRDSFAAPTLSSYSDLATSSSLKRQASVRKILTLSKKKSFTINFKLQIENLFESLRKTRLNFAFCVLPNLLPTQQSSPDMSILASSALNEDPIDVPLLRRQLKAYQLVAACRMHRQGYPDSLPYSEFVRKYRMLINNDLNAMGDDKEVSARLVDALEMEPSQFKMGFSQLFLRAGVLAKLDDQREDRINNMVVALQSLARGLLARRAIERRKVQHAAIRCIQKNIRKHLAIKEWKWWKLYTNLMPIINVQSSEAAVKQLQEENDELKKKCERLTVDKNDLKLMNTQLEAKLMALQTEYVEEHAANAGTIDLLEVETSERMRLERELSEIRPMYNEALRKIEAVEGELLECRLARTKKDLDFDGLGDGDGDGEGEAGGTVGGVSEERYEKLRRDFEMLKRQMRIEKENASELNENSKRFLEGKLKEVNAANEELDRQVAVLKRKWQKGIEEMQDLQRALDDTRARNRELERLQAKHDLETEGLRSAFGEEAAVRERVQRERDSMQYECYSLRSDLEARNLDLDYHKEKIARLEKDLKELEAIGTVSTDGSQLAKLKAALRDLESKIKEQEDELDEQAATIQQLDQCKLKLEMQLEKEKQKWQRELNEKESEMDDLRFHTQKKIKAIEMQLEEECELSSGLQREKRELERRLRDSHNEKMAYGQSCDAEQLVKMKRQLQRYKALASDAQTQLERLKETVPRQAVLKALKSQLEDSEATKTTALKAKQLMQNEINELQQQLEDVVASKQHLDEVNMRLQHECNELKAQLDDETRECDDVLKKYQNHIQNFSLDSNRFVEMSNQVDLLAMENRMLKDSIRELESKISFYETSWVDKLILNKIENKVRDLECRLDLESTHKNRVQTQLERIRQQYDSCLAEIDSLTTRDKKNDETIKRLHRINKDIQEEMTDLKKRCVDLEEAKKRLEHENEILEKELNAYKNDLKISMNRIENFQNALNNINETSEFEFESENDVGLNSDTDDEYNFINPEQYDIDMKAYSSASNTANNTFLNESVNSKNFNRFMAKDSNKSSFC